MDPSIIFALIVGGLVLTVAIVAVVIAFAIWLLVKLIGCIAALFGAVLAGSAVAIIVLVLLIAALALLGWFFFRTHRLPLVLIGLGHLVHIPAVPFNLSELPGTARRLARRISQTDQAKKGLSTEFTIGGRTTDGYTFMYGTATDESWTRLSLEEPKQFAMGWTTFGGVAHRGELVLNDLARTLTDAGAATADFWPIIAKFGLAFNLIILENVTAERGAALKAALGAAWSDEMQALREGGNLYVIDMRLFEQFPPATVEGFPRFTPATLTFLKREPDSGGIAPFAIRVSGQNGSGLQHFVRSDPAWLYALQAAKTSIGAWGIWIGHVYQWHIVTAAMQMTMFQTFGTRHIVRRLLGRQSKYLIAFDEFLLLNWRIAPPTSVDSSAKFLQTMDAFAVDRAFGADDPKTALATLGLRKEDFSKHADWDQYPVVRYLLAMWDAAERYVGTVIDAHYQGDDDVRRDAELQSWIRASGDPAQGNVRGLPQMDGKAALKVVLTSLIFRVTAHGASRLDQSCNPMLTFVANFPPCLQIAEIPRPDTVMSTTQLLAYLPKTGTIGGLISFMYTFISSPPYEPLIPLAGIDADQSFTGTTAEACNAALVRFRRDVQAFMTLWAYDADVQGPPAQIHQWELNIET